jgi:pyridinium-3,5-bisthiocarboxylic acid mononucleotide nickel chelatase
MKVLYYDCFAGISGDMNLGAMVDLGVPADHLKAELEKLALPGYELAVREERRRGFRGTKVDVLLTESGHSHGRGHRHPRRTLADIEAIVGASSLPAAVQATSLRIFRRLAHVEAGVHGQDVSAVHFHEVGAIDAIVDVVGAAVCLAWLDVTKVFSSPVELGGGFVQCAHGTLPVPAPATMELLKGVPVRYGIVPFETTTPTGAAILTSVVDEFTERPRFTPVRIGCGLGTRELDIPNVLRVVLGEQAAQGYTGAWEKDEAVLLACNIDDMNPELYDYVMEVLFEAGAQDVFLAPIVMKKSRPAVVVNVLCRGADEERMTELLLRETTTIGVRAAAVTKAMLRRDAAVVRTEFGDVAVKRVYLGDRLIRSKPEYEDCKRLAREHGVSLGEIYRRLEQHRE